VVERWTGVFISLAQTAELREFAAECARRRREAAAQRRVGAVVVVVVQQSHFGIAHLVRRHRRLLVLQRVCSMAIEGVALFTFVRYSLIAMNENDY
jgi:hypothetical protein